MGLSEILSFPHTAAVTPESLRSSLGRGGIGTPRGFVRYFFLPPHSGGYTRVPPVQPGPRGDRDAPWFRQVVFLPPHSGGYTRVPPVQPWPRGDRDAPWVRQVFFLPPHSGGYTRVPPVQPWPRRDRDPVGPSGSFPSPTQRRLHPSPSGPARAAGG